DSARAIIQARKSQSLSPRPPPLEFAHAILRLDIQEYGEHKSQAGLVFFDRGVVDAVGMLHAVGALPENELKVTGTRLRVRTRPRLSEGKEVVSTILWERAR